MSNTATASPTRQQARGRIVYPLVATVATVIVWLIAHATLDDGLRAASGDDVQEIGLPMVIVVTLLVGFAALGVVTLLDRKSPKARTLWTVISSVVFLLSLLGPAGSGEGGGSKVALLCMHVVVALVLIPGFARTARKD
ncbi:hypothetical protein E6R18_21640 [Streptomyces sp. A1277]|uniref:DUF6069 family protein n=1 Tax=Streptomyces sp. A1277 TaxID=2563103 RepID=UPI0010A2A406|nr:DUF6069 family protein [Streptomyces sp. A1277]THA30061.1 hypothetical protein E6R18_21640 [Streptomyces sp. A1277]